MFKIITGLAAHTSNKHCFWSFTSWIGAWW